MIRCNTEVAHQSASSFSFTLNFQMFAWMLSKSSNEDLFECGERVRHFFFKLKASEEQGYQNQVFMVWKDIITQSNLLLKHTLLESVPTEMGEGWIYILRFQVYAILHNKTLIRLYPGFYSFKPLTTCIWHRWLSEILQQKDKSLKTLGKTEIKYN